MVTRPHLSPWCLWLLQLTNSRSITALSSKLSQSRLEIHHPKTGQTQWSLSDLPDSSNEICFVVSVWGQILTHVRLAWCLCPIPHGSGVRCHPPWCHVSCLPYLYNFRVPSPCQEGYRNVSIFIRRDQIPHRRNQQHSKYSVIRYFNAKHLVILTPRKL